MKRLISFVLLVGCATPGPEPVAPNQVDPKLMAQMCFTADGARQCGFSLLPRKTSTKFVFEIPKDTWIFMLTTCGRHVPILNPDASQAKFEFVYAPAWEVENMGSCVLTATAVTKGGEYHRAAVDFVNSSGKDLKARFYCNGVWSDVSGAAACQVAEGFPLRVKTDVPTLVEPIEGCPPAVELVPRKEFEFKAAPGFCGWDFMDAKGNTLRVSSLGYTSILNVFPPKGGK